MSTLLLAAAAVRGLHWASVLSTYVGESGTATRKFSAVYPANIRSLERFMLLLESPIFRGRPVRPYIAGFAARKPKVQTRYLLEIFGF